MTLNETFSIDLNLPREKIAAELSAFLPRAAELACVPVSGFRVGAAALGTSGRVWLGANQEFAGLPLNFTVHAEQAAVLNARSHGETKLLALAVSAAPCGYCRQFLRELGTPLDIVLNGRILPLDSLLPEAFALGGAKEALLSRARDFSLLSACAADEAVLAAAEASYSPYTGTKSGVALRCASGRVFCGCLLESAAYNPSLTALQSALTLRALESARADPVAEAVLAESGPAPLRALFASLMLRMAPGADVRFTAV